MKLEIKPLAKLDAPLLEAIVALGDSDPWLRVQLADRVSVGPGWYSVVGLGMAARLWEPNREELREVTAKILAGEYDPRVGLAARWGRSLTENQADTLEGLTIAAVGHLFDDLSWLRYATANNKLSPEGVEACAVGYLSDRDDIECALVVLHAAGHDQVIRENMLPLVDAAGERLVAELPEHVGMSDTRLTRVWASFHDLWWGRPPDTETNLLALAEGHFRV